MAAVSKSIRPAPRRARNALAPIGQPRAGRGMAAVEHVAVLVRALGHVGLRPVRDRGEAVASALSASSCAAFSSGSAPSAPRPPPSARRRAPRPWPSWRRRSPWPARCAAPGWPARPTADLRASSRAISAAESGARPRRARSRSKASGFSRMARMSCIEVEAFNSLMPRRACASAGTPLMPRTSVKFGVVGSSLTREPGCQRRPGGSSCSAPSYGSGQNRDQRPRCERLAAAFEACSLASAPFFSIMADRDDAALVEDQRREGEGEHREGVGRERARPRCRR